MAIIPKKPARPQCYGCNHSTALREYKNYKLADGRTITVCINCQLDNSAQDWLQTNQKPSLLKQYGPTIVLLAAAALVIPALAGGLINFVIAAIAGSQALQLIITIVILAVIFGKRH